MESGRCRWSVGIATVAVLGLAWVTPAQAGGVTSSASTYRQVNLVSDVAGMAQVTDPNLVNPWGMSFAPTGPLWVSDNGTDVSTLYQGGVHGSPEQVDSLVVSIPGGAPTGQVFNPTSDFVVHASDGSSGPALFVFVGESGHLTGWNPNVPSGNPPSTSAENAVVTRGGIYKGLALGMLDAPRLYAANFSGGTVDMFNGQFDRVITAGNFVDPKLPVGYAPFNVAVLNGLVYVAYAKQDADKVDEVAGPGLGRLDVFSLSGKLKASMADTRKLNAPWGMTIAPAGFGTFSGELLVGNFGNGRIHAYDPDTLALAGTLADAKNRPISIDGLWALMPGNGVQSGRDEVIFTAGPDGEKHGLLGNIAVNG